MTLTWDSLVSHLPYTYLDSEGGRDFHTHCVKDYSHMIYLLASLYEKETKRKK
jgi:hypothetical protein